MKSRAPSHPVVRAVYEPLARFVASTVGPKESSVLDVGCGNGFLQYYLEQHFKKVIGLDNSRLMLNMNPCKNKCLSSCTHIPFPDDAFDVVVGAAFLHHLDEIDQLLTLSEMKRVGKTVISFEPNRNNPLMFLFGLFYKEERRTLDFTSAYMKDLFRATRLKNIETHTLGWIAPNKSPKWWIPCGNFINSYFKIFGLTICTRGET